MPTGSKRSAGAITLAAAAILMVTMGTRQSFGLFISPLESSTGLGITTISLAFAIAQLMWGVILGVLAAAGSGAGSFSVLIGAASRHLTADKRGKAAGIINAGGSLGQFAFAPVAQTLIQMLGWMGAMWSLAVITVGALPLVRVVSPGPVRGGADAIGSSPWQAVRTAMEDRSYLLLHAGFFTCGFHIAFLVTHLPGEVNLCGLPPTVASWSLALIGLANIVGSLIAGACTVGKLFGVRYLSTLFGLTLLSHQIGGFFGAYLGGLALVRFGDYQWMWYADMALAAAAALINLPIRETRTHAAFASSP